VYSYPIFYVEEFVKIDNDGTAEKGDTLSRSEAHRRGYDVPYISSIPQIF